jgi:hypothetical protein
MMMGEGIRGGGTSNYTVWRVGNTKALSMSVKRPEDVNIGVG